MPKQVPAKESLDSWKVALAPRDRPGTGTTGAPGHRARPAVPAHPARPPRSRPAARSRLARRSGASRWVAARRATVLAPTVRPDGRPDVTLTVGSGSGALTTKALSTTLHGERTWPRREGERGKGSQIHDITIIKKIDKASTKLYQACETGKHFPKATITVTAGAASST